jgi:hypothetical protein
VPCPQPLNLRQICQRAISVAKRREIMVVRPSQRNDHFLRNRRSLQSHDDSGRQGETKNNSLGYPRAQHSDVKEKILCFQLRWADQRIQGLRDETKRIIEDYQSVPGRNLSSVSQGIDSLGMLRSLRSNCQKIFGHHREARPSNGHPIDFRLFARVQSAEPRV